MIAPVCQSGQPRWLSWMLVIRRLQVWPLLGQQHSFMEIDREIFSMVILSLPVIKEGQLSVSDKWMYTILGWLSHKTSTQTKSFLSHEESVKQTVCSFSSECSDTLAQFWAVCICNKLHFHLFFQKKKLRDRNGCITRYSARQQLYGKNYHIIMLGAC